MRTKKFMYNIVSAALFQILSLLFGLILPRLFIVTYGSEVNGLISSTTQFVSYFQYVEFGLGAALIYALYNPLANSDYIKINEIVSTAKKAYIKASIYYFLLVVSLSLIYPLLLTRENIDLPTTIALIIVIGVYGAIDFYTLAKYRVLLTADQRYYVVTIASIIALLFNFVLTVILINYNYNIVVVKVVPLLTFLIRSIILKKYTKKHYPNLVFKCDSTYKIKKEKRIDALIFQLSISIINSLPIILISFISLKLASVFSIYYMIFMGVAGILAVFTAGSSASFGNIIANGEKENLKKIHNEYEFSLYLIIALLFSDSLILCDPFISVYTKGVNDAEYVNWFYGFLFVIWSVIYNARLPQTALVNGAGYYKQTRNANIIQIVLFITTIIFLNKLQIFGVLIAMIVSALYRTLDLIFKINIAVADKGYEKSLLRLIRIFFIIFFAYTSFVFVVDITCNNLIEWFSLALMATTWCAIITVFINLLFDKQTFQGVLKRVVNFGFFF